MAVTPAYRQAGPCVGLSVVATSHAAVALTLFEGSQCNYVLFENTGTLAAFVNMGTTANGQTVAAAAVPGDGTAGGFTVLPGRPKVIACPTFPMSVTAIATAAGPTLITATPVTNL